MYTYTHTHTHTHTPTYTHTHTHSALSNTRISKLPVNGLRQLQELDLSLTPSYRELFPAFTGNTSDIYQGKTFPLLRDAKFFYHAHCCHLTDPQNTDYHYLVEMANTPPPILDILQELSSRQVREVGATTEGELLCFNTTTSEAVDISVSVDAQNVTVDEFCADYCSLQPDICMGGCSNDSGPASGMESEIVCVQRPVPTPTACYSPESFSSQVTTTVCSSVSVASPGPSPTPLDICSTEFCETQSVFDFTQCDLCQQFGLGCTDADPTCLVFIIIGRLPPGFCDCHTQRRKREVAAHSENTVVHKGQSRTERATTECQVERVGVVCRSAVACPSPSPSQRRRRSEASQGLPEGWFFPDSNSTDVICSRGTLPPPRCPLPLDLSGYEGAEIPMCSPEPDAFHPCEDLLGNADILRVAIWFVIIMALIMNMIVIIVTIGYSFILHRTKQELFIMHFLYLNLAMADFLMGVYLFSIAVVDLDTLGDFAAAAIRWQTGPGCRFAGFCAITSTVVSVYTLVVITLERTYTIVNVMHRRKLSKKVAFTVMALGWVLGVVMGLLPLVGVNDYSTVAVCLPFDVSTKMAKGYIAFLLLATGLSFIVIVGSYLLIFYEVTCSEGKRRLRSGALSSVWKQELRVGLRMFFLVFTNFVCWFPIALLSLSAAFGESLLTNVSVAKVFIVFVFPLNACVNPILYSISTTKFRQNFCLLLGKCGLFQQTNARIKSKRHGIPSHTSKGSGQFSPREYLRRLSTRLISLSSIPSVSTSDDGRRDSRVADIRRESNFSQGSFDDHRHLLAARRSSNFSTLSNNSSNEELGSGYKVPRRNSAFSDSSQEEQATGFPNPAYRSDSPPVARDEKLRQATKISASSLGTLPEEVEVAPTPVQEVVQNQGYTDEEEEGYYTEQKDSSSTTPDSNTESLVHKSGVIDPQSLQHHIMELPSAQTALGPHGNDTVPTAVIDTSDSSSQLETESMKEEIVFDEPLTCL